MAIVFGGQVGLREDSYTAFARKITEEFRRVSGDLAQVLDNPYSGNTSSAPPSTESVYIDSGFSSVPGTAFVGSQVSSIDDIKTRQIITQEPQATVYVKKRAFWALRNENNAKFMDSGDKLFTRATKILFENKCTQLAAYEGLTKASRLISEDAHLDSARIDAITDYLNAGYENLLDTAEKNVLGVMKSSPELTEALMTALDEMKSNWSAIGSVISNLNKIGREQKKLNGSTYTNWVVDPENIADIMGTGRGAGVIELTCVSEISTELGIEDNKGSISFTVEDPLNLTKITNDDLEMALNAANREVGMIRGGQQPSLGPTKLLEDAKYQDEQLRRIRSTRLSNGNFLSGSSVADIVFEVNGSTQGGDKVMGYVSGVAEPFTQYNFNFAFNGLPAAQMLTREETTLVQKIFQLLNDYANEVTRLTHAAKADNENPDVMYARRNLRNFYLGKSLIQPMDGVHVYLRGSTLRGSELVGPMSYLLNNTNFIQSFQRQDQDATYDMLKEEMRQFGIKELDIPVDLYKMLRTGSFMRNAGTHVFGGLVSTVVEAYNPDRGYTLSVSGQSNLKWLDLSRVNVTPSLNQTQGVLEDPLTPYEFEVDPGTGLVVSEPAPLQENLRLIADGKLTYTHGSHKGEKVTQDNLVQDYSESSALKIIQHAPGMVYKWKNGIMTVTREVNLYTALDGTGIKKDKLAREVGLTVVENPFSSMDAADVVSILVTGYPHNYESFLSHTRGNGLFVFGAATNAPESYFGSTFDLMRSTNQALGNFQPFKTINIPAQQMAKRLSIQAQLQNESQSLNKLRAEYAALQDQIRSLNTPTDQLVDKTLKKDTEGASNKAEIDAERAKVMPDLKKRLADKEKELVTRETNIRNSITAGKDNGLRIYGTDQALEIESADGPDEANTSINRMRIKNELLQMRTQYRCKFNEDANFFMVGDEYDKDLDIQTFVLNLMSSIPMWTSEFKHPYEICSSVAKTLDMEFFSDSQGHIQFRFPRYNKVPLSLILKMILLQQKDHIQLYPTALESLFNTKYTSLREEATVLDLQIQVDTILLGKKPEMTPLLAQIDEKKYINMADYLGLNQAKTPNEKDANLPKLLIETRSTLRSKQGGQAIVVDAQTLADATKELAQYNDAASPNMVSNRVSRFNNIAQLVSRKQRIVDVLGKMDKQKKQFGEFDVTKLRGTPLTADSVKQILSQFSDLVEDDYNDLLGPGSASRYIITDDRVINSTFTESDQNVFCRVDVTGEQNLLGEGAGQFGGMPMIWAGATDFDLWRQYGYRSYGPIHKPFFKSGPSQCAPYAQMLLTRSKKDAVRGSLTVTGNEYYQLGDVVYVNCRDLLYYVTGVKHNFTYGSGFTTTLELRLGHPLGEYIPTPMDIIGKTMIKNQVAFNNVKSYRQTASRSGGSVVGAIKFDTAGVSVSSDAEFKNMLSGKSYRYNVAQLKNALLVIRKNLGAPGLGNYPKVEVRGFSSGPAEDNTAILRMDAVMTWLTSPCVIEGGVTCSLSEADFPPLNAKTDFEPFTDYNYPIRMANVLSGGKAVTGPVMDVQPSTEARSLMYGNSESPASVVEIVLVFKAKPKQEQ